MLRPVSEEPAESPEAEPAPSARRPTMVLAVAVVLVLAFWGAAQSCHWFLDTPFLMRPIDAPDAVGSSRTLTAVESLLTLTAALFLVPAIALVAHSLRNRRSPLDAVEGFLKGDPRVVPVLMASIAVAGSAFVGYALTRHVPLLDDERSYMFQAELFAKGKIFEEALPKALRNPMILVTPVHASKYPPGNAMLLALGVLAHAPYLVHPLIAGALVITVHTFVRDLYGVRQAHLAAALLAISPFTWAIHSSVLCFGPTALAFALTLAGVVRHRKTGSASSAAVAGAAAAFLLLCRPLDGVALGIPTLAWGVWKSPRRRAFLVAATLGYAALAWIVPVHNKLVGGSITTLPWTLDHEAPMRFGFQRSFRGPYVHTPLGAMAIESTMLLRLDGWLIGVPGALAFVGIGLARRDATGGTALLRALLAIFWLGWIFIPVPGTWDVGPTYTYVLVPILFPLFGRGIAALVTTATKLATDARALVHWALVATVVAAAVSTTPLRFARLTVLADEIQAPWDTVARAPIGECVVVAPPAIARAAAGWGYGYPYEIPTGETTKAHLFMPLNRAEYEAGRPHLPAVPTYALQLDGPQSIRDGVRVFNVVPFDVDKAFPKPADHGPGASGITVP